MVIRLIDTKQPIPWVHPAERGQDGAMVFHIIPLTEGQSRKLNSAHPTAMVNGTVTLDRSSLMTDMFMSNVTRIENVTWPGADHSVDIGSGDELRRFLDSFPSESFGPIYEAIQNTAALDEGAAKNSVGSRDSST